MGPVNPLTQMAAPQSQAPQMPQLSDEQVAKGHEMAQALIGTLMELAARPKGQLTKQDVFQAAAGLLGKGLFDDPQARAGLVAQLTQLPDDETALRQTIGKEILQASQWRTGLDNVAKQQRMQQGQQQPGQQLAPGAGPVAAPPMPGGQ